MDPGVSSVQAVKLFTAYKRRMKNAKKRFFFFLFSTRTVALSAARPGAWQLQRT